MSIIPKYTGRIQRFKLDKARRKEVYDLAVKLGEITHMDLVANLGVTAGNWFNRCHDLVCTGMLVITNKTRYNPQTKEYQQVYAPTDRKKPKLVCVATEESLEWLKKDMRQMAVPANGVQPKDWAAVLTIAESFVTPRIIGAVDGKTLRQRYEAHLEPDLPLIKGWEIIWKY